MAQLLAQLRKTRLGKEYRLLLHRFLSLLAGLHRRNYRVSHR
jgi:hypothetical protein